MVLLGRDSIAKHRPVAGVADSGGAVNDRGYSYAGNTVESVTSLSMVCLRTFSTVAPTFDPSRSTYPDLLALFERTARHHLEQNALFCRRIIEHLDDDCFSLSDVSQQSQVCRQRSAFAWTADPRVPAKSIRPSLAVPSVSVVTTNQCT